MWRLAAVEKVATLAEIRDHWTMDAVLDANDCLDHQIDLTTWLRGPAPPKTEQRRR